MRVAHRLASLIAVLAAVVLLVQGVPAQDNSSYSVRRSVRSLPPHPNNHWVSTDRDSGSGEGRQKRGWLTAREMQAVVRREGGDTGIPVDCCPSVLEMVEPTGGKNQDGMYVELYMDGDIRQRFYELSCRTDVENKPCRFVDRKLYNQSRCVQKFSYTYALVRDGGDHPQRHQQRRQRHFPSLPDGGWMLDYIRVRSGCACELKAKRKPHKPHAHERKKHEVDAIESPPDT